MSSIIKLEHIHKHYHRGDENLHVLNDFNLDIESGDMLAIMGPSGSGKTTLMNILGLLDTPSSGDFYLNGEKLESLTDDRRSELRGRHIGFVFQSFYLLPKLTAFENICLPGEIQKLDKKIIERRALELLEQMDIVQYKDHKPNALSGGQQQRVAVARALLCEPDLILADEPTGALDQKTSQTIMDLFLKLNREFNRTIVMITHDPKISAYCGRTVYVG